MKNIILLFVSITICILFSEIIARSTFKGILETQVQNGKKIDPYAENPYIIKFKPFGHSHIPVSSYIQSRKSYAVQYKINSLGFRGSEISLSPASNVKRIVAVGDSMIEGHGSEFEESFPFQLGKNLGDKFEVINCGMQGSGPLYYALNLERYFQLNPQVMLLSIFTNDIMDDRNLEYAYDTFSPIENISPFLRRHPLSFLFHSKLFQIFYLFKQKYFHKNNELENLLNKNKKEFLAKSVLYPKQIEHFQNRNHKVVNELIGYSWSFSEQYLDYILRECKKRNIDLVLLDLTPFSRIQDSKEDSNFAENHISEALKSWAESKKISYFSSEKFIRDRLRQTPNHPLSLEDDGHPTPETHSMLAKVMVEFILTQPK